jgi:two-component system CheB/CheR fusion protein
VSAFRKLEGELEQSRHDVETAYEELQSTNEELETSNEELQSTVEELQTTNEELQSTNEEMETVNEELQSTNAELETTNDELRERTAEADRASGFLSSILNGLSTGVVVVDKDFTVLMWNRAAEELWGLRSEEVRGRSLMDLDIGLPVEELKRPIGKALVDPDNSSADKVKPIFLEAVNRRGKSIHMRITLNKKPEDGSEPAGIVLWMEQEPK